jgi:hypothetical protein
MNPHYRGVAARAGHRCEYCHAPEAVFNFPFEVEHVVPVLLGGGHDDANLALACRSCNVFKAAFTIGRDPEAQEEVALFHPRHQAWEEHFRPSLDSGEIVGLTPTGRVTVVRLQMNGDLQRSARRQWVRLGLFP